VSNKGDKKEGKKKTSKRVPGGKRSKEKEKSLAKKQSKSTKGARTGSRAIQKKGAIRQPELGEKGTTLKKRRNLGGDTWKGEKTLFNTKEGKKKKR